MESQRKNLSVLRGHPLTQAELKGSGLTACNPPRRCDEGHLCTLWPCQTCAVDRQRPRLTITVEAGELRRLFPQLDATPTLPPPLPLVRRVYPPEPEEILPMLVTNDDGTAIEHDDDAREDAKIARVLEGINDLTPLHVATQIEALDEEFAETRRQYEAKKRTLEALQLVVNAANGCDEDGETIEQPTATKASSDDTLFDRVVNTLAEHGKLRAKQIAEIVGHPVESVNYVLNNNEGFLSPGAGWWMIDA
jgi:hypothetical protein